MSDLPLPPVKSLKKMVADSIMEVWDRRWKEEPTCRQTRLWLPSINPRLSAQLMTENRRELSQYILILSGHGFWRRHNYLVDRERLRRGEIQEEELVPPYCDLCLEEMPDPRVVGAEFDEYLQTPFHLFTQCEALALVRLRVFGQAYGIRLDEIKKANILTFVREAGLSVFPKDNSEVVDIDRSNLLGEDDEGH